MRALVTGATGFIGKKLVSLLDSPVVLSRDPEQARSLVPGAQVYPWDPEIGSPPAEALEGIEAVFNLAGEPIGRRWTPARKARIRSSRVLGTRNLVEGLRRMQNPPAVLVSASAVGYYGSRGDEILEEDAGPGNDFLAEVSSEWEEEARAAGESGIRVVTARLGIVLGREGGALAQLLLPFRLGLGGPLGSGRHYWPWVHLEDAARMFLHAAETSDLSGPMNVVSPEPVTNRAFSRTLGSVLKRPSLLPVPTPVLRIIMGELSTMLLASQRAMPGAAVRSGFTFQFSGLAEALIEIIG